MRFTFMRSVFLTAVLLGLYTGSAIAAETCEDYAAKAAAMAVQARQLGCMGMVSTATLVSDGQPVSFTGPAWSTDPAEHLSWCRAHGNYEAYNKEMNDLSDRRYGSMMMCQWCNTDATKASQQTQAAADLKCGFTGPQWDNYSFATQMQACFKGRWTGGFIISVSDMAYQNIDRDKNLAICKQEKTIQAKLSAGDSRYTKRPYLKRNVPRVRPNALNDAAADPDCKWCKSTKSSVTGAPQRGGSSAMDRLGDMNNNNNLGNVSGNSGSAEVGRSATPRPTSPKAQPSADAVVRAPTASSTANGGFKSKPILNPISNDPNPIR